MGGKPRRKLPRAVRYGRAFVGTDGADITRARMAVQAYLDAYGGVENGFTYDQGEERLAETIAELIVQARIEGVKPDRISIPSKMIASCPFCTGQPLIERVRRMPPGPLAQPRLRRLRRLPRQAADYYVRCRSCAAHGPWMKSASSAIRMWNLRPRRPR